jgi:hypothetical protein
MLNGYSKCGLTAWSKKDEVQIIDISGNYEVLVDKDYYESNCLYDWRMCNNYACRKEGKKTILMHRDVLNVLDSKFAIDHINGNTLDNRRCNLRLATIKENFRNAKKVEKSNTTSRLKGVSKYGKKWKASISKYGERVNLGTYNTEIEAAIRYDVAAIYLYGEFARINFTEQKDRLLNEREQMISNNKIPSHILHY